MIPAPELPVDCPSLRQTLVSSTPQQRHSGPPLLESVIKSLEGRGGRSRYGIQYTADLRESLDALVSQNDGRLQFVDMTAENSSSYLRSCIEHVDELYGLLEAAMAPSSSSSGSRSIYQRPRVSPTFFLYQLSRNRWNLLSEGWKKCIARYAVALIAMQQAERLIKLSEKEDLIKELGNPGHQTWDPMQYPESLLMEVESDFFVRDVQA